jgi:A/G-specific adenine glycosylase
MDLCGAFQQGVVDRIPRKTRKTKYEDRREAAVVIRNRGRVLMRKCQVGERWAGLWDFPRFQLTQPAGARQRQELQRHLVALTGGPVQIGTRLLTMRHGVTRFRIQLDCYEAEFAERPPRMKAPLKWVAMSRLHRYPLSVTGRKIGNSVLQDPYG